MPEKTLLSETRDLVRASDLTYPEIAKRAKVKTDWLKQIMRRRGNIKEPGVHKVQRVFDFLSCRASRGPAAKRRRSA